MFAKFLVFAAVCGFATSATISKDVNDVKFFYYPTARDEQEIVYNTAKSLDNLVSGAQTVLLIDGFLSDATSPMSQSTKNSVLDKAQSQLNVIVVDWGKLSGAGMPLGNLLETALAYGTVLGNVGPIGERVADFLHFLNGKNIHASNIQIIGHSLGAHIAGAAGVFYQRKYGGTLGRISGLDPAGPFFSLQVDSDKRLHKGDAAFIDIYHTNRGTLGDSDHQTGDINVYINGGDNQPGCEEADSSGFAGYCSHSYSWKLFDTTYHSDLRACPCSGLPCQCNENCNTNCDNPITVGARTPLSASGPYHLTTNDPLTQYA